MKKKQKNFLNKDDLKKIPLSIISLARFIDIVIISLVQIGIYFLFINVLKDKEKMIIAFSLLVVSFLSIFFYFILLPSCLNGRTLAKLMFKIVIYKKDYKKLNFWNIFCREFIFLFIPWLIYLSGWFIGTIILYTNDDSDPKKIANILSIVVRLSSIFSVIWMVFLAITIYFQKDHRSWIDLKQDIYVMEKKYIKNQKNQKEKQKIEAPAIIDEDLLKDFLESEKR